MKPSELALRLPVRVIADREQPSIWLELLTADDVKLAEGQCNGCMAQIALALNHHEALVGLARRAESLIPHSLVGADIRELLATIEREGGA